MDESEQINRRGFLKIATWSMGGLMSLMVGIPAIAYILGPALPREKSQGWVRLGSINKVGLGMPELFKVRLTREAGWLAGTRGEYWDLRTDRQRAGFHRHVKHLYPPWMSRAMDCRQGNLP